MVLIVRLGSGPAVPAVLLIPASGERKTMLCRELRAEAGVVLSPHSRRLQQTAVQSETSARSASAVAPDPRSTLDAASLTTASAEVELTATEGAASMDALDPGTEPDAAPLPVTSAELVPTATELADDFGEADEGPDMADTGAMERAGDLFVAGTAVYPEPSGAAGDLSA